MFFFLENGGNIQLDFSFLGFSGIKNCEFGSLGGEGGFLGDDGRSDFRVIYFLF